MIITIILNYCYRIYNKIADIIRNKSIKCCITPDSHPPLCFREDLHTSKKIENWKECYILSRSVPLGE